MTTSIESLTSGAAEERSSKSSSREVKNASSLKLENGDQILARDAALQKSDTDRNVASSRRGVGSIVNIVKGATASQTPADARPHHGEFFGHGKVLGGATIVPMRSEARTTGGSGHFLAQNQRNSTAYRNLPVHHITCPPQTSTGIHPVPFHVQSQDKVDSLTQCSNHPAMLIADNSAAGPVIHGGTLPGTPGIQADFSGHSRNGSQRRELVCYTNSNTLEHSKREDGGRFSGGSIQGRFLGSAIPWEMQDQHPEILDQSQSILITAIRGALGALGTAGISSTSRSEIPAGQELGGSTTFDEACRDLSGVANTEAVETSAEQNSKNDRENAMASGPSHALAENFKSASPGEAMIMAISRTESESSREVNNAYNDIGLVVTRTKGLEKILKDLFGATGERNGACVLGVTNCFVEKGG